MVEQILVGYYLIAVRMKQLSFKDLPIRQANESSPNNSKINLQYSSVSWHNQSQLRIQSLRKKYDSPSFSKSVKQPPLVDSTLVDITNLNESHVISRDAVSRQYVKKSENLSNKYQYSGEEVVLQKVKMMKQSLLSDKGIIGRLKTEQQRNTQIAKNYQLKYQNDSRAENIDRINSKIKHILNCLNQNQKSNIDKFDKSYLDSTNKENCSLTRSCQNTKNYHSKLKKPIQSPNQNIPKFNSKCQSQNNKQISRQLNQQPKVNKHDKQLSLQNNKQKYRYSYKNQNQNVNRSKSNYCLHKRTNCQSIDFKNNSKFDEQIEKIQLKIKKFEEEKRKLNIQFKPFQYQRPARNSIDNHKVSSAYRLSQITKNSDKATDIEHPITPFIKNNIQSANLQQLQKVNKQNLIQNIVQRRLLLQKQNNNSQETFQKQFQEKQFRRKMCDGIQQRKKKLINHTPSFNINNRNSTTKLLIKALTQLVQKDQQLRNAKIWFSNNSDLNKFNKVKQELAKLNIFLDISQIKLEFQITDEQNNPFFSVRQSRETYQSLAKKYCTAYQYWNSNLFKKFKRLDLQSSSFTVKKIDLERKGHIVLEDLVRLLNMQTGKFFRNRDLILIFRRFTKSSQMIFQDFLKIITQHQ